MTHTDVGKHAGLLSPRRQTFSPEQPQEKSSPSVGQSRRYQVQDEVNCHSGTTYTSDHHGGIPRSPASPAPDPALRIRFGAAHNPGRNTHARHLRAFRTGNRQLDGGTAPSITLAWTHLLWFQEILVFLFLPCPITQHKLPLPRAHGLLRRLRTILTASYRRRELAPRAWLSPAM